ncbi:hypothetical protein [Amycolatopsis echigonensis]|nr:hypothetical protein [Amycolatopsis niigatensis]
MVLAISFLEAPIKFRAPGVTVPIGLSIGRLVFRALNIIECVFAAALLVAIPLAAPQPAALVAPLVAVAALLGQLGGVRPWLNQRTKAVLAGATRARSRGHYVYVAMEGVKVIALALGGILLLVSAP